MKFPDLQPNDVVQVRWLDSFSSHGVSWDDTNYQEDCSDILSIGYFLQKTVRYFIIAQSICADPTDVESQLGGVWRIPTGCIVEVIKF